MNFRLIEFSERSSSVGISITGSFPSTEDMRNDAWEITIDEKAGTWTYRDVKMGTHGATARIGEPIHVRWSGKPSIMMVINAVYSEGFEKALEIAMQIGRNLEKSGRIGEIPREPVRCF